MNKRDTKNLLDSLTSTPDLDLFLAEHEKCFSCSTFHKLLNRMFLKSGLSKASLAKLSGTSEVYLYQIFIGARTPSRDRTLCLCFGLSATLAEAQELLRQNGNAQLYAKNRRDAIIIYYLVNKMTLDEVNDKLFEENEETLC